MATDKPEMLFDARVVERNISRGLVTREEYEAWLAGLEDCSDLGVESSTFFAYSGEAPEQEVQVTREEIKSRLERDAKAREAAIIARRSQA